MCSFKIQKSIISSEIIETVFTGAVTNFIFSIFPVRINTLEMYSWCHKSYFEQETTIYVIDFETKIWFRETKLFLMLHFLLFLFFPFRSSSLSFIHCCQPFCDVSTLYLISTLNLNLFDSNLFDSAFNKSTIIEQRIT